MWPRNNRDCLPFRKRTAWFTPKFAEVAETPDIDGLCTNALIFWEICLFEIDFHNLSYQNQLYHAIPRLSKSRCSPLVIFCLFMLRWLDPRC